MPKVFELALPKKAPVQASIPIVQTGSSETAASNPSRRTRRLSCGAPSSDTPWIWNTFFAKSIPTNSTIISISSILRHAHSVAVEGRDIHPIKYKAKFGGMNVSDAKKLRALEDASNRLKWMLADTMPDNAAHIDVATRNFWHLLSTRISAAPPGRPQTAGPRQGPDPPRLSLHCRPAR